MRTCAGRRRPAHRPSGSSDPRPSPCPAAASSASSDQLGVRGRTLLRHPRAAVYAVPGRQLWDRGAARVLEQVDSLTPGGSPAGERWRFVDVESASLSTSVARGRRQSTAGEYWPQISAPHAVWCMGLRADADWCPCRALVDCIGAEGRRWGGTPSGCRVDKWLSRTRRAEHCR